MIPKKNFHLIPMLQWNDRAYSEKIPMLQSWRGFFYIRNYDYSTRELLSQNLRFDNVCCYRSSSPPSDVVARWSTDRRLLPRVERQRDGEERDHLPDGGPGIPSRRAHLYRKQHKPHQTGHNNSPCRHEL